MLEQVVVRSGLADQDLHQVVAVARLCGRVLQRCGVLRQPVPREPAAQRVGEREPRLRVVRLGHLLNPGERRKKGRITVCQFLWVKLHDGQPGTGLPEARRH